MNADAQLVALELIRRALVDLPQSIAANVARGQEREADKNGGTGGGSSLAAAMSRAALGTAYNPLPPPPGPPPPRDRGADVMSMLGGVGRGVKAGGRSGVGGVAALAGALAARFGALIGPVAALTAVMNSAGSGAGVVGKSMQLLGATIAPLVLPVMMTLAVGLIELSDVILTQLKPVMVDFAQFMVGSAIPAVVAFVRRMNEGSGYLKEITGPDKPAVKGEAQRDVWDDVQGLLESMGSRQQKERDAARDQAFQESQAMHAAIEARVTAAEAAGTGTAAEARRLMGAPAPGTTPGDADFVGPLPEGFAPPAQQARPGPRSKDDALQDVIKSLTLSLGPKASIGSLGNVRNQAMTAALNVDPIDARILKVQQDMLREMQKVVTNTTPGGPGGVAGFAGGK